MPRERRDLDDDRGNDLGGDLDRDAQLVAFPCSLCDRPAATARLAADSEVIVEGLVCRITQRIERANEPRLRAILAARDACGLRAFDAEWGAFYCPDCDRSYCADHWHFDVRYDDDFPGWYDCTYGTCPAGHRYLVDD
jgi:hypothetical protein